MKRLALHTWFLYLFSVWKEIRINKWDHTLTKDHTLYLFAAEPNWTYKGFKKTPSHYADSKQTWRSYLTWYWQLESRFFFFFFFSSLVGPIFFYFILFKNFRSPVLVSLQYQTLSWFGLKKTLMFDALTHSDFPRSQEFSVSARADQHRSRLTVNHGSDLGKSHALEMSQFGLTKSLK